MIRPSLRVCYGSVLEFSLASASLPSLSSVKIPLQAESTEGNEGNEGRCVFSPERRHFWISASQPFRFLALSLLPSAACALCRLTERLPHARFQRFSFNPYPLPSRLPHSTFDISRTPLLEFRGRNLVIETNNHNLVG